MLKKFFIFILCLFPWFISSLFPVDYNYYDSLNLPFFAPPSIFYGIVWPTIYILIAINISSLLNTYKFRDIPWSYKITLLINYIFNQSYIIVAFLLKNNFLGFISCLGTFISGLYLYEETSQLKMDKLKLLLPYLALSLFASILSLTIYFLNI